MRRRRRESLAACAQHRSQSDTQTRNERQRDTDIETERQRDREREADRFEGQVALLVRALDLQLLAVLQRQRQLLPIGCVCERDGVKKASNAPLRQTTEVATE